LADRGNATGPERVPAFRDFRCRPHRETTWNRLVADQFTGKKSR
jgi:hypothetical protein